MKKQVFRSSLSFDLAKPERSTLQVGMSGVSMPREFKQVMDAEVDIFKHIEGFGFFGGSNNANTFHPELNVPKDLIPKPEDFVEVPFRLISATTVGGGSWKATDFSNVSILKGSKDKLLEKPIYYDHDTDLLNWVGIVKSIKWTEPFTNSDGVRVPGGIDAVLAIDGKTNPKIARGVLMGSIFSNSVTVSFDWVPSHTFENMYDFQNKIGDMHSDGTMIRRIVTEIHDYYETSLVWLGADPFAKLIDKDGNLKNIDVSNISYSKLDEVTKKIYEDQHKYSVQFGIDANILHLSKRKDSLNPQINMKDQLLAQLAVLLGMKADDITVDSLSKLVVVDDAKEAINAQNAALAAVINPVLVSFAAEQKLPGPITDHAAFFKTHGIVSTEALTKYKEDSEKLPALSTEVEGLTAEVVTLKKEKEELASDAVIGKNFISLKRAEVKRLYTLNIGGAEKADAAVLKLIDEAKEDGLEGLLKQYVKDATMKFSGACKKCGSDEFEFRSTVSSPETERSVVEKQGVSFNDIYNKYAKRGMDMTGLKKEK